MSNGNWWFECPYCGEENECYVDEHDGPGQEYIDTQLPDECIECGKGLSHLWHDLEIDIISHYVEYHARPPEKEWFEDVDFSPLGSLY